MTLANWFGVVLATISFALVLTARFQLGKAFAVTPQAKALVQHGLYSRIRHPMYLFVDLTVIGIALATGRWYILLLLAILLVLQIRNAKKERELLDAKFGNEYELYRRGTWF